MDSAAPADLFGQPDILTRDALAEAAAGVLHALRTRRPAVHAITSPVAADLTANALLALGCRPSLSVDPHEIVDFVTGAQALLLNLGMLDPLRRESLPLAAAAARRLGRPAVLDPVFIDVASGRLALASALAAEATVVKLNEAEARHAQVLPAAVLCLTGPRDRVQAGPRQASVGNGHAFMAQVTAMGCAAGALMAAALAVEPDPFLAAAGTLALVGVAGGMAGEAAGGPGSFRSLFLDRLADVSAADLQERILC